MEPTLASADGKLQVCFIQPAFPSNISTAGRVAHNLTASKRTADSWRAVACRLPSGKLSEGVAVVCGLPVGRKVWHLRMIINTQQTEDGIVSSHPPMHSLPLTRLAHVAVAGHAVWFLF